MTSMRSRSGPGTVSIVLAVAMNSTLREVERHVEVVVGERVVLRRVEHFEQRAMAGSPRKSAPSLSISSSIMTGLRVPALRSSAMMRPGIEPM